MMYIILYMQVIIDKEEERKKNCMPVLVHAKMAQYHRTRV
jgi:hypothetical protein